MNLYFIHNILQLLKNMIIKGRYQFIKGFENNPITVGFGSYGQVKLGKDKQTGQTVAIKIVYKLAKNQVVFHNKLSHPKIIQLLNHHVDKEKQITYMILEYADGGTLFQSIRNNALTKPLIRRYFYDICQAIAYMHNREIMHRDIKPENILLTKKKQAKLCDFGFAAILGQRSTLCGTYEYMSPQMIQGKQYDYKIDIWALGILLFQMIAGHAPFRGDSPEQVLNQMKTKIVFSQKFDAQQINLIKTILRVTAQKRPDINQILAQPYFTQQRNSTKSSQQQNKIKLISVNKVQNVATQVPQQKKQQPQMISQTGFYKPPQNSFPGYTASNVSKQQQPIKQQPSIKNWNGGFNQPQQPQQPQQPPQQQPINLSKTFGQHQQQQIRQNLSRFG